MMDLNEFANNEYDKVAIGLIAYQEAHKDSELLPVMVEVANRLKLEAENAPLPMEYFGLVKVFAAIGTLSAMALWQLELDDDDVEDWPT